MCACGAADRRMATIDFARNPMKRWLPWEFLSMAIASIMARSFGPMGPRDRSETKAIEAQRHVQRGRRGDHSRHRSSSVWMVQ